MLKEGTLKRKPGQKGLEGAADIVKWDGMHNELEAFRDRKTHMGAIDPRTGKFYKPPAPPREAFGK